MAILRGGKEENFAESYLATDDHANVFVLKRQLDGETRDESMRLNTCGELHVGDYTNAICKGSLCSHSESEEAGSDSGGVNADSREERYKENSVILGTVTGALVSLIPIDDRDYEYFAALEQSINANLPSVGQLDHRRWRAFKNERKTANKSGFIDGDLVESLLELYVEAEAAKRREASTSSSSSSSSMERTPTAAWRVLEAIAADLTLELERRRDPSVQGGKINQDRAALP